MGRYGRLVIDRDADGELIITTTDPSVLAEITRAGKVAALLGIRRTSTEWTLQPWARGQIKQELLKLGWPAEDHAGYTPGTPHEIGLVETGWAMRGYQQKAIDNFFDGGSGVVVLPCGAGKTIVGAGAMAEADTTTLILVTNTVSARQWRTELLKRTTLTEDEIGEYSGERKEIRPVTIATYQILTAKRKGEFAHLALLDALDWGLIIYDEVHLLPAPVFKLHRRTAGPSSPRPDRDARARRRAGIGCLQPDRPETLRRPLERDRSAGLHLPRLLLRSAHRPACIRSPRVRGERRRSSATASPPPRPRKLQVVKDLLAKHEGERILVIGQYLDQIDTLAEVLNAPALTGATPVAERERLYEEFRTGRLKVLVVSKVANFSIDLPEATVAIQVSGSFGSRQEEAQRLGRLLRPKRAASRRRSTPSSRATPWIRISRRTASGSSPSRGIRTRFWTRPGSRLNDISASGDANGVAAHPRRCRMPGLPWAHV